MDALTQMAETAAVSVASAAETVVTHEAHAARQPIRNLIMAKPFGSVIAALLAGFVFGAPIGAFISHLV